MSDVVMQVKGSAPEISFSDRALQHILTYLQKQSDCKGLRLSVKKTGCSGLSYVIDYVSITDVADVVLPLSDQYVVSIDKASYPYLKGVHIDYVQQGLNYKFVFNNPNQTGECGCGESFTVA